MDLKGIIAISGKPGLHKVVAQGKNNVIVESLTDGRRFPAFASDRISALDDICIYTYEEEMPLVEVYKKLAELEGYKKSISHNENKEKLREKLTTFLADYDKERVYDNDIKKLFQWYNLLVDKKIIKEEKKEVKAEKEEKVEKTEKKKTTKPAAAKKPAAKKKEAETKTKK